MSDYFGAETRVDFSNDFPKLILVATDRTEDGKQLSETESRVVGEVIRCLTEPGKSREICLRGLTKAGAKRLRTLLEQHKVDYTYVPMTHHYRAPSEPARLVVNVH